jgi:hypothetical protein
MRTTVLLAVSLILIAPAAYARGGGSHHASHSDITVTKTTDKGSTKMMSRDAASGQATGKRMYKPVKATSTSLLRGNNQNNQKGGRYLASATKKLPGKRKPPTLTLKRGQNND